MWVFPTIRQKRAKKAIEDFKKQWNAVSDPSARYNMFERWVENGLLDVLQEEGVGCIAYSPLAQGSLTDKYLNGIPAGSRASREGTTVAGRYLSEEHLEQIRKLK